MKFVNVHFFAVSLLVSSLGLTACFERNDAAPEPQCAQTATFRNNLCGYGAWGAYVLEMENGEIVQPWVATGDLANFKPSPNQKVRLTVSTVERDDRYNNVAICQALGPYSGRMGRAGQITCLSPVDEPNK
ncbi:MAG: hypothetical protein MUC97_02425 [Bernardetiaceae bacterium]|jgi:hypothetical protein|nr:hypothetical protein [Bernardetiaceae bacterium]